MTKYRHAGLEVKGQALLPTQLERTGRVTVLWTLEPDTWSGNRDDMFTCAMNNARPGSIVIMHVEISSRVEERAALPTVIRGLKQRGFRFATLSQQLAYGDAEPQGSVSW